jgi:hypothetical protein
MLCSIPVTWGSKGRYHAVASLWGSGGHSGSGVDVARWIVVDVASTGMDDTAPIHPVIANTASKIRKKRANINSPHKTVIGIIKPIAL